MKKKSYIACLCTLALGLFATSCDDHADDPKYRSLPPTFADMDLKMLEDGSTTLRAGEKILATCVQTKPGRLINKATYKWSAKPVDAAHSFKKEVIYDLQNFNPTDTLVFEKPGTYTLAFTGQYHTSGQSQIVSNIVDIDKGKITYETPTFLYYKVTVEKRFTVK